MKTEFEIFKEEIIKRQIKLEFEPFIHNYLIAENWCQILKLLKRTLHLHCKWSIEHSLLSEELFEMIPIDELEAENIYGQKSQTLNDPSGILIFRDGSEATINMTGVNKVKVYAINANLSLNLDGTSMVEVECYNQSQIQAEVNGNSLICATPFHQTISNLNLNQNSIGKLKTFGMSDVTVNLFDDSYLNAFTYWESYLKLTGKIRNATIRKRENSTISRQIK